MGVVPEWSAWPVKMTLNRLGAAMDDGGTVPDRADFDPMPWQSMAVWMLTQLKRWGYIKGDVNYKQIAEQVFLLTDAKKTMKSLDMKVPEGAYPGFKVMGKAFDPARPEPYLDSFAIRRT